MSKQLDENQKLRILDMARRAGRAAAAEIAEEFSHKLHLAPLKELKKQLNVGGDTSVARAEFEIHLEIGELVVYGCLRGLIECSVASQVTEMVVEVGPGPHSEAGNIRREILLSDSFSEKIVSEIFLKIYPMVRPDISLQQVTLEEAVEMLKELDKAEQSTPTDHPAPSAN